MKIVADIIKDFKSEFTRATVQNRFIEELEIQNNFATAKSQARASLNTLVSKGVVNIVSGGKYKLIKSIIVDSDCIYYEEI